jgi:hypothetical protein
MAFEKLVPSTHGRHLRLDLAVPSSAIPEPMSHSSNGRHSSSLSKVVKVPGEQPPHVLSVEAVAAAVMCSPGGHGSRTGAHAAPSSVPENVDPTTHGSH